MLAKFLPLSSARWPNLIVLILGLCSAALAQGGASSPQAKDTNGKSDQNARSVARINPSTLAMEFSLPMMNYPGRGGNSVPFGLSYSSKVWRMDDYATYWYPQPVSGLRQYVTLLRPVFAERSSAGWTSSISFPAIEERVELFDQEGRPYSFENEIGNYDTTFQQAITLNAPGFNSIPPPPNEYCGWRCSSYFCEGYGDPDDGFGCTCWGWTFITSGCGGGGGGGGILIANPMHYVKRVRVRLGDGTTHEFRKSEGVHSYCTGGYNDGPGCNGSTSGTDNLGDFFSVDGSGIRLNRTTTGSTLYFSNGDKIVFTATPTSAANQTTLYYATEMQDVDGNRTNYSETGSGSNVVRSLTDTVGRQLNDPLPRNFHQQNQVEGDQQVSIPGLGSNQSYMLKWRHLEPVSCAPGVTTNCGNPEGALDDGLTTDYYTSHYCFGSAMGPTYPSNDVLFPSEGVGLRSCNLFATTNGTQPVGIRFNPVVLTEVSLPNGKSYRFRYNQYGEVVKLIHPTGGYERFTYQQIAPMSGYNQQAYDQANRGVTEHQVFTFDGALVGRTKYNSSIDLSNVYTVTSVSPHQNSSISANPMVEGMKSVRRMFASDPNDVKFGFETALAGMVFDERTYDEAGALRSRTLVKPKVESIQVGSPNFPATATAERDARPERSVSIIFDGSNALATLSTIGYDSPGVADPKYFAHLNVKSTQSTQFASVSAATASSDSLSWTTIDGWFSGTPLASRSETDYKYTAQGGDIYMNRGIIGMPTESRSMNPGNPAEALAKTQPVYDEGGQYSLILAGTDSQWVDPGSTAVRGNVTTTRTWVKDNNTWLDSHAQYDNFGNLRKVWDVSGDSGKFVETSYGYRFAFPISITSPAPDPTNTHGSNQSSTVTSTFDLNSGFLLTVTDEFGQTTKTDYNDPFFRPTSVYGLNFSAPSVSTSYDDDARTVTVTKQLGNGVTDTSTTYMDTLGRPIKTKAVDTQGDVFADTHYDILGRVDRVSSPYRTGETIYWNQTKYDALGRAFQTFAPVIEPNLAIAQSLGTTTFGLSTSGSIGTKVQTTDASLRTGSSISNALGQLLRVDEPDNNGNLGSQPTFYTYDPYGNMVRVQQGNQNRYFKYNSLGRLIRLMQPEQDTNSAISLSDSYNPTGLWSAAFSYDVLGNVMSATDARGVTISNTYDRAGRVKTRTYSGETGAQTSPISFYYDGKGLSQQQWPNYAKGKLTRVDNGVSATEYMLFDNLGRVTRSRQITDGVVYGTDQQPMTYSYSLGGTLLEETYPSGRIVKNEIESDGDLLKVSSRKAGNVVFKPYVSNFSYTASGGITQMKLGNGKWENTVFNDRMQVTQLGVGASATDTGIWKVNYEYGELPTGTGTGTGTGSETVDTSKNTGNIAKQTLTIPGTSFVQTYRYDPLYRLTEAKERTGTSQTNNWIQNWTYDRYGNRQAFTQNIGGNTTVTNPSVNQNTNRFTSSDFIYDKNGNVTRDRDGVTNQLRTFVFNGENKQTEVRDGNNAVIGQYFYDGEGKRVKKFITATGETTIFVYSNGKLVAEYSNNIAGPSEAKIAYTTTDHLGSPRVITDDIGQVRSRRDFLPFGEEINTPIGGRTGESGHGYSVPTDGIRQKFTGYQKDTETSLDFAEARMYENRFGRFTAVDPLLASGKSANPQTFNRYSYVGNNPVIVTDPSGECPEGQCPSRHRGLVYTKKANGIDRYNNEQPDDSWTVFTGEARITDSKDNYAYRIFGDGTYSGSGWQRIDPTVQALIGSVGKGFDDVQTGSWTGLKNVPSTLWNTGTTATFLPFSSIRSDPSGLPELFIPNPLLANGFSYANERQAKWGQQVTAGAIAVPGVFAAPFAAAGSPLSVVSRPLGTTQRLQMHVTRAASVVDSSGDAAFTFKQFEAIKRNPNLRPMFRGNRIDVMARDFVRRDSNLFQIQSNYNRGADFVHPNSGRWWDMTTPGQWQRHVNKYGPNGTLLRTQ